MSERKRNDGRVWRASESETARSRTTSLKILRENALMIWVILFNMLLVSPWKASEVGWGPLVIHLEWCEAEELSFVAFVVDALV